MKFKYIYSKKDRTVRAFTYLEGLIVLSMFVVLSSMSIIAYTTYHKSLRIKNAASEINSLLNTARLYAITQQEYFQVAINFDAADRNTISYWIDKIDNLGNINKPKITTPHYLPDFITITDITILSTMTGTTQNYNLPIGLTIPIVFTPEGTSDMATIHLIHQDADTAVDTNYYTIKLYAPTAKSKIFRHERK